MTVSQNKRILRDLSRGKKITSLDALRNYGTLRLSGRIYDLKKDGHVINSRIVETNNGKRVAEYTLVKLAGHA